MVFSTQPDTTMKALQAFVYGCRSLDFLMKACRAFIFL